MSSALHGDTGLQPERTTLAWARTMMALATAGAIFLRWVPHHGLPVLALVTVTLATAVFTTASQRQRYTNSAKGIAKEAYPGRLQCRPLDDVVCRSFRGFGVAIVLVG